VRIQPRAQIGELGQDLRGHVRHPFVVADFEHLGALLGRWVYRALQQHAEQRLTARHRRSAEQDVHENHTATGQLASLEGLGFAIVRNYRAKFVFFIEVHAIPPIQY
jgi:hypothetical protein